MGLPGGSGNWPADLRICLVNNSRTEVWSLPGSERLRRRKQTSVFLGWRTPWTEWILAEAGSMGLQKSRQDLVTKQQQRDLLYIFYKISFVGSFCCKSHFGIWFPLALWYLWYTELLEMISTFFTYGFVFLFKKQFSLRQTIVIFTHTFLKCCQPWFSQFLVYLTSLSDTVY